MIKPFIPNTFIPPTTFQTDHFYFKVLDDDIAELDYAAVMSSQKRLQGIFGPASNWPDPKMTLADNIASLKIHKHEFNTRKAFAFSVLDKSQNIYLGSIYIDPSPSVDYDCCVYLWIKDEYICLDKTLHQAVSAWLCTHWPFENVLYPDRDY
ncbi:hypothetical protein HJP15_06750 [Pseudoalteromonas sp. NEC-BIFX-2020_002]|uniref:GNAT family N-acetyltransferase n=1 Tax=Pseudoalteromonas neustonica TaxID=1840331 RepID=A0ABU9TWU8_9GAMM|nr:hypothetical protein [Pseudoalteromonas sp. NEC-BIFX-2020_002]NNG42624.1 hypothetical protein [Pseudoalteromonas sp. NEC-BIFX-2020_002]